MLIENIDSRGSTRSVLFALQPTRVPRSDRSKFDSLAVLVIVTAPGYKKYYGWWSGTEKYVHFGAGEKLT